MVLVRDMIHSRYWVIYMGVVDISSGGLLAVAETFNEGCGGVDASSGCDVDDHCWLVSAEHELLR